MKSFFAQQEKDHLLSGVDARVKLVAAIAVLLMVLSYKGFIFPALVTAISLMLCRKMGVSLKSFVLRLSEPAVLALVLVALKFFFSGREALFSVDIFGITLAGHKDGLIEGLLIAGRIAGAVSVVAVLGFSTPFPELMAGLSWLRVPRGFVEILMLAYRYIFVLLEEALVIYHAQKNRLGYSNFRRGMSSFGALAGSLTLRAFEHSHNTTVAMVQRGYDGNIPAIKHKPFLPSEVITSVLFLVVLGIVWKL